MSSVDMDAWTRPDPSGGDPNRVELPYVLVADTNVERTAMCLDAIRPFKAGVLVARDGDEATRILDRFGPPILLIIDLSLARRDGFAVIEAAREGRGRTEIIAWAASGTERVRCPEASGFNAFRARTADAARSSMRSATGRSARRRRVRFRPLRNCTMMAALAEKARYLARTPVAVYLRAPTTQFRRQSPGRPTRPSSFAYYMPRVSADLETERPFCPIRDPLLPTLTPTLQDVAAADCRADYVAERSDCWNDLRLRSRRSPERSYGRAEGARPVGSFSN
jgi:CheY-like chemotaxis protein